MAKVVGQEQGIDFINTVVDVYNAEFLDQWNPLRQIPTLIVDDSYTIFDSRNIFAFFDELSDKPSIMPGSDMAHATRVSLLLGLTEVGLQRRMEIVRPEEDQSQSILEKLAVKINRSIDHIESEAEEITGGDLRLEQIVAACALEYTDYRFNDEWRNRCPKLNAWVSEFSERTFMVESRPNE